MFKCKPPALHFFFDKLYKRYTTAFDVHNKTPNQIPLEFIIPPGFPLSTSCGTRISLFPNQQSSFSPLFAPSEFIKYVGEMKLRSREEIIVIPVDATPMYTNIILPPIVSFGQCKVGTRITKAFSFEAMYDLEYPFSVDVRELHPCVQTSATEALIPRQGYLNWSLTLVTDPTVFVDTGIITLGKLTISGNGIRSRTTTIQCEIVGPLPSPEETKGMAKISTTETSHGKYRRPLVPLQKLNIAIQAIVTHQASSHHFPVSPVPTNLLELDRHTGETPKILTQKATLPTIVHIHDWYDQLSTKFNRNGIITKQDRNHLRTKTGPTLTSTSTGLSSTNNTSTLETTTLTTSALSSLQRGTTQPTTTDETPTTTDQTRTESSRTHSRTKYSSSKSSFVDSVTGSSQLTNELLSQPITLETLQGQPAKQPQPIKEDDNHHEAPKIPTFSTPVVTAPLISTIPSSHSHSHSYTESFSLSGSTSITGASSTSDFSVTSQGMVPKSKNSTATSSGSSVLHARLIENSRQEAVVWTVPGLQQSIQEKSQSTYNANFFMDATQAIHAILNAAIEIELTQTDTLQKIHHAASKFVSFMRFSHNVSGARTCVIQCENHNDLLRMYGGMKWRCKGSVTYYDRVGSKK
ncbi:hypothetical protein BLNAU_13022 [Blattamonas nauphoetae]|uniref:Arrestin C-terminal-like domain-containing protein n=1 Tax=Blattamonas nauphoetae TaxID=2049346 RepID=A0ABQ9XKP0_9EUKA|nr:hypothetical protein BLNAU_13022 [Blattamonas nauphoetae]